MPIKRLILSLIVFLLAGCGGSSNVTAASAVEEYVKVRITGDEAKLVALTCKDRESAARTEAAGFRQGNTRIESVSCKESGKEGQFTVVRCEGKMIKNYGGEDTTINLADRAFKMIQEDGQWRVCGYTR